MVHSTFTLSAHCPINCMTPYVEIKQVNLSSEGTALSNGKCDLGSNSRRSCVSEISPFHVETKLFTFFGINRLCRRKDFRPEVHLTAKLWSSVHENQDPSISHSSASTHLVSSRQDVNGYCLISIIGSTWERRSQRIQIRAIPRTLPSWKDPSVTKIMSSSDGHLAQH